MSPWRSVRLRHEATPLLKEREQYLTHLMQQGFERAVIRIIAAYLVHIVRVMSMTSPCSVEQEDIDTAGEQWAAYEGPLRRKLKLKGSPITFVRIDQRLRFHGRLSVPGPHPFQQLIA